MIMQGERPLSTRQQELVLGAKPYIDVIASALARRTPHPAEELRAVGYEAAMRATRRFDEGLGVPFHVFMLKAVKGAMLDVAFPRHKSRELYVGAPDPALASSDADASFEEAELTPLEDHTIGIVLSASFPSGASLERAGWSALVVSALRELVAALPPSEQALAHAFYWDGLTFDQAAARLDVPKRTLHREHARLKAKLLRGLRQRRLVETG